MGTSLFVVNALILDEDFECEVTENLVHDSSSDGFVLAKEIDMPCEHTHDIDTCELDFNDNPKTSSWKNKDEKAKCALMLAEKKHLNFVQMNLSTRMNT